MRSSASSWSPGDFIRIPVRVSNTVLDFLGNP